MLDRQAAIDHQRVRGEARVALTAKGGVTRLLRLRQVGAAKAMLPAVGGSVPEVVFLNTAGGLTGGDVLDYALDLDDGAQATVTTQAAERIYDCGGATARVSARFDVGRGGRLDWLPQETILYDRADLRRDTRIDLDADASCLATELLVFGRHAMGEVVRQMHLSDRRVVLRQGQPVTVEPLRITATLLAARPALLRGARATASLVLVARGAEAASAALHDITVEGVETAVSGWDGRLNLRAFATESMLLRRYMVAVLERLRGGCRVPRVWQP